MKMKNIGLEMSKGLLNISAMLIILFIMAAPILLIEEYPLVIVYASASIVATWVLLYVFAKLKFTVFLSKSRAEGLKKIRNGIEPVALIIYIVFLVIDVIMAMGKGSYIERMDYSNTAVFLILGFIIYAAMRTMDHYSSEDI